MHRVVTVRKKARGVQQRTAGGEEASGAREAVREAFWTCPAGGRSLRLAALLHLTTHKAADAPTNADARRPENEVAQRVRAPHDDAASLCAMAHAQVETSRLPSGGKDRSERANAAREVVRQSVVALRDLLKHGASPDPAGAVFLDALLKSLERIDKGEDPRSALNLDAGGRVARDDDFMRDWMLFMSVGQEVDRLRAQGAKRAAFGDGVGVIERAKQQAARQYGGDRAAVDAAWKAFGAERGWKVSQTRRRSGKPKLV